MYKTALILLMAISILSFNSCSEEGEKETKTRNEKEMVTENFNWLLGSWERTGEEAGKETFENWQKISDTEYTGLGFTMQNEDTIKQEKIRLLKSDDNWSLEVQPQDEPSPITFNMTSFNDKEFICENKALDFPKLIKYWKSENKLNALVSGDDMEISFEFERIK